MRQSGVTVPLQYSTISLLFFAEEMLKVEDKGVTASMYFSNKRNEHLVPVLPLLLKKKLPTAQITNIFGC